MENTNFLFPRLLKSPPPSETYIFAARRGATGRHDAGGHELRCQYRKRTSSACPIEASFDWCFRTAAEVGLVISNDSTVTDALLTAAEQGSKTVRGVVTWSLGWKNEWCSVRGICLGCE